MIKVLWVTAFCATAMLASHQPVCAQDRSHTSDDASKGKASMLPHAPISVLPMMYMEGAEKCGEPHSAVGGYTRIYLYYQYDNMAARERPRPDLSSDGAATERRYEKESRNWFKRFFLGKSVTRLLSVKAGLSRPQVDITTVLTSISHTSNKKEGESWSTDFNSNRLLTPFFRLDPESNINLELTLKVSASYDSAIAKGTLDVLKRAVGLVAPKAPLLTSLNQERFDQASQFVDGAISSLLHEAIVERATNDFPASEWAGCDLAKVQLWSPMRNDVTPTDREPDQDTRYLGTWTISTAPAVISVFSDVRWPAREADQDAAT